MRRSTGDRARRRRSASPTGRCTTPRAAARSRTAPRSAAALGRTVPVATYSWGEPGAPAVLLVHGWRSRASAFGRIIEDLTGAGLRVVAYDAPAHGDSGGRGRTGLDDLDIIRRLSDAENAPWAAVVGHSLGVLAAGIALHEGVRTERFTAISALPSVRAATDWFVRVAGLPWALRGRFATAVQRYGLPGHPDVYERFDLLTRTVPASVPALWIHDAGDRINPHALSEQLHDAHAASSELFTTTGLGHNQILGDPVGPVQDPGPRGGPGVRIAASPGQPHPNAQMLP